MTHAEIAATYHATAGANVYALGFQFDRALYVAKLTFEQLSAYFKNDRASSKRGGFLKIRIRMTAEQRKALAETAENLGSYDDLVKVDNKYNDGENFERVLTERWTGETWVKDSKPYYEGGDLNVDGVEIQVKLDGAELTNERVVLKGLAARAAA